ncbi:hypothetical protein RM704_39250 [Streptomyces sp. DSM 3412]|uniref:Glycine transporter domain-containing protein n=1 Tax=Streptomyces gottesmaniae TaxID=3075518 RepID=A0ABU2Z9Y6_9ACTN|nr:hypothetical protein [Streptomyces sp. DSM 3412]MDT0573413.1 hypothetical protein [Streptomyces sp. DSM 3412]
MTSPLVTARSFVANPLLWSFFAEGLAAGVGAGAVLDGTRKNMATIAGSVVALITGSRIAKKPKSKAFLSRPGTSRTVPGTRGGPAERSSTAVRFPPPNSQSAPPGLRIIRLHRCVRQRREDAGLCVPAAEHASEHRVGLAR